ncbi:conserved hypothetical protein [Neospora caninum Liverpool]|uniref:C2 domain-containing protein n=1 Tax=Neospora caninum (strain Liverpool) TaxID=572307 RepID=F0VB20_NEOCL|nr:conserved hypothetical protein [Neospora caninum Liverpool]CBZ50842.1 conserved hypothetical protein [Neospora caninum Liverpool]CEL68143.1 TPA: hypothetical protein BN1204_039170 [Neospora caninum Liverpool]|eukprot:XP_003880875.1 conserved hypothetical protein [Neospora caninum Liverpool]
MNAFFDYILEDVTPAGAEYDPSIARPYCKVCKKDAWLSWTGKYSDYCSVECMNKDTRANINSERNADLPRNRGSSPEPGEVFQRATVAKKVAKELKSMAQARKAQASALVAREEQLQNENEFRLQQQKLKQMAEALHWDRRLSLAQKEDMSEQLERRRTRETGNNRGSVADTRGQESAKEARKREKTNSKRQLDKEASKHAVDEDKRHEEALHADEEGHEEEKRRIADKAKGQVQEEGRLYRHEVLGGNEGGAQERLIQLERETSETHNRSLQIDDKVGKSERAIEHELATQPTHTREQARTVAQADECDRHMSSLRSNHLSSQQGAANSREAVGKSDNAARKQENTKEDGDRNLQSVTETELRVPRKRAGSNSTASLKRSGSKFQKKSVPEEATAAAFVAKQVKQAVENAVSELRQSILTPRRSGRAVGQTKDSNRKKKQLHVTTDDLAVLRRAALTQLQLEMDSVREPDAFISSYIGTLWIWLDSVKGVNPRRLSFGDSLFVVVRCPTQEQQWQKWRSRRTLNLRWGEEWSFPISYRSYPSHRFMRFELWKRNARHGSANFLGEGQVPFPCFETRWNGDIQLCWNTLLGGDRIDLDCGQLHIGLEFSPIRRDREAASCGTAGDRHKIRRARGPSHETAARGRRKQPADLTDEAVQVNCVPAVDAEEAPAGPPLALPVQPRKKVDETVQVDGTTIIASVESGAEISRPPAIPMACEGVQVDGEHHIAEACLSNETVSTPNPSEEVAPTPDVTEAELDTMMPAVLAQMDEYACRVEGRDEVLPVNFDSRVLLSRVHASPGCRVTCSNKLCRRSVRSHDLRDLFEEEEFRAWGLCSVCQHTIFQTQCPSKPPKTVVLGEEDGLPYGEFRLDSAVPVAFPDFAVVWPSSGHLFVAQGFSRLELQERIRQCTTKSELRAVLRAPLLRFFLRRDWDSFKYQALKVCLDLKVDQHPRLQLLLSATGDSPISCPQREDPMYMTAIDSCDLANAVGEILMDKRNEFQSL